MGQRSYKKRQWVQVIFPTEWRKWSKKWPKIKGGKWRNMQLHYSSTFLMRIQQQWPPSSQVLLASNFFMISFYERMNGAVHGYKVTKWWSLFLSSSFFFYLLAGADDLLWCIRKGITVFLGQLFYNSVGTSSLLPREVTRCCRILFGAGRKYITHGRWYVLRLCVLGRSSSYSSSSSSYSSLE